MDNNLNIIKEWLASRKEEMHKEFFRNLDNATESDFREYCWSIWHLFESAAPATQRKCAADVCYRFKKFYEFDRQAFRSTNAFRKFNSEWNATRASEANATGWAKKNDII